MGRTLQSLPPGSSLDRRLDALLAALVTVSVAARLRTGRRSVEPVEREEAAGTGQPDEGSTLRRRYLAVFWLFRLADWLQGPYFYEVYASKRVDGRLLSEADVARLFLTGFGAQALLGPLAGSLVDRKGRKAGSLAGAALSLLAAVSTHSRALPGLFAGRVAGGVGAGLLGAAPEAWLAAARGRHGLPWAWLRDTFAMQYVGDSVAAILAGQLASAVAARWGPQAPFAASSLFLAAGSALAAGTWEENVAEPEGGATAPAEADSAPLVPRLLGAWRVIVADPRILSVGAVQALFEGAMYIFVMQWPPAMMAAVGTSGPVPFGKVFSCFMASCMAGGSLFGLLSPSGAAVERIVTGTLGIATASMVGAATMSRSAFLLLANFVIFETCVGVYFPSISTLRSRYVPDSHRGVIMSMFRVPLNVLVSAVLLGSERLGQRGSLLCAAAALQCGFLAQLRLLGSGAGRRR